GALQGSYPCSLWGEVIQLEGAQELAVFADDYYANGPALTSHQFGQGRAYYLATHGNADLLGKLLRQLCQQAQVASVLETPAGIEATKRVRTDGRELLFLLNHSEQPQQVKLPAGTFTSLLDGRAVEGQIDVKGLDVVVLQS
ncbi:MAG TPA: beta-galactosidase trimerization domain-containing protein, partial [Ktedonobacteraceae bacterium]|nr:beta-galactosidase trimerization domain-containing protein [Ktedonobacteraceae bacterium]